jgi:DNA-binding transcriptional ArsR family regulator
MTGEPVNAELSEKVVLGACLHDLGATEHAIRECPPSSFFLPAHVDIAVAARDCWENLGAVDAQLVAQELLAQGHLERAGGECYLEQLKAAADAAAMRDGDLYLNPHVAAVKDAAALRRVGEAAHAIQRAVEAGDKDGVRAALARATAAASVEGTPTTGLRVERWHDLDAAETETRWLVGGLVTRDAFVFLASHPKAGKSILALDLAVAVGAKDGGTFLGFPVEDHGAALVFCAEDRLPAVRRRIDRLHRGRGLAEPSDVRVICETRINLDDPATLARLRQAVGQVRPRLLVIDPLRRVTEADENDATQMAGVLGDLRALQRDYGCAVLVLHHFKKATEGVGEAQQMRGSSDIFAAGDAYLLVEPRREGVRRMTVQLREAVAPEPFEYQLHDVPDGDGVALRFERVESEDKTAKTRTLIFSALVDGPLSGSKLEERVGGNHAEVRRLRDVMVAEGVITSEEGPRKARYYRLPCDSAQISGAGLGAVGGLDPQGTPANDPAHPARPLREGGVGRGRGAPGRDDLDDPAQGFRQGTLIELH